jgi:hypothetical protein
MAEVTADILRDAIARNAAVVLSLPSAGMWRHYKSRFLAESVEGLWVESVPGERPLLDQLMASGGSAALAFKGGANKVAFAAPVRRREAGYTLGGGASVEALLLDFPPELKAIQRRNSYRVSVADGSDFSVRVWRVAEKVALSERPPAAQELKCAARDVSHGGVGVILTGEDGRPPKVSDEDRLRVQLTFRDIVLLVEGRLRFPVGPITVPATRAGIQFKALDADLAGRQASAKLSKIVGELHRDEIRRHRLGV